MTSSISNIVGLFIQGISPSPSKYVTHSPPFLSIETLVSAFNLFHPDVRNHGIDSDSSHPLVEASSRLSGRTTREID